MCVLLGATATQSKENLLEWLDTIVLSVATTEVLVYDHRRQRLEGEYCGLRSNEVNTIISRISGLLEWAAECVQHQWSCGTLLVASMGGHGNLTTNPLLIGPFQKCY